MKTMWRSLALVLCASLQGCYLLKAQPPKAEEEAIPDLTPLVQTFAQCFSRISEAACENSVSFPFYVDGNPLSAQEFSEELPQDRGDEALPEFSLQYRVHPLSELGFYYPEAWQKLQSQADFTEIAPQLRTLVVNVFIAEQRPELLVMLLKKTPQGWRIVGFNDG